MPEVRTGVLVVGAGVTGLAFAQALRTDDYLVCEASDDVGGYCRTVRRDGFVWDYSGHFFHFRHPEIEAWLRRGSGAQRVRRVAEVRHRSWQGPPHRLPLPEEHPPARRRGLHRVPAGRLRGRGRPPSRRDFREMLYARFGRGHLREVPDPVQREALRDRPGALDMDAMGRFFPARRRRRLLARTSAAPNNADLQLHVHLSGGRRHRVRDALCSDGSRRGRIASQRAGGRARPRAALAAHAAVDDRRTTRWSLGRRSDSCSRSRACPRPAASSPEQGARVQPGLRPQGARRTCTGSTSRTARCRSTASASTTTSSTTDRMSLYVEIGFAPTPT